MFSLKRAKNRPHTEIKLNIALFVELDDDGSFHASAPAFKGLHVSGATQAEAITNAQDAVILYIESLQRHGDPLPVGQHLTVEEKQYVPSPTATRTSVTVEWPSMQMCGVS